MFDIIFYIFYKAFHTERIKTRWFDNSQGARYNSLRAITGVITFYGLMILAGTLVIFKIVVPYGSAGIIVGAVIWFIIMAFVDAAIQKRYTDEKFAELQERYDSRFSRQRARLIVGLIIITPFVAVMFLSGK